MDDIIGGGTPSTDNPKYWTTDNDGIFWVSISDITESKGTLYKTEKRITKEGLNSKNLKIIPKETLLISIFASLGKTTILKIDATVNQAILGLVVSNKLTTDLLKYYLIFIENYISYFSSSNTQENLNLNKIKNLPIVLPQLPEQTAIANYLDKKTDEIDKLIAKKENLLELYEEEKTAIINQAVTKGIDTDAKFKDSGIDWLGEIPEHWEVQRVATLGAFSKGKGIPRSELKESGCPTILYGDIYTKYNIKTDLIFNHISEETTKSSVEIKSGDILFTGSGETKEDIGKCITYVGDETVYVGGDVIILKQEKCNSLFLSYSLNSNACIFQKAGMAKGQIIVHIYASNLREIILPLPSIEEQTQIVQYIETETARIDVKAENTQKLIELLKEYKTALISEVVTGKVRVIN